MNPEFLRREAVRIYRRYQVEIVEALKLCPWAERARLDGRVREHVVLATAPDLDSVLGAVAELADDPQVEIGLLLFPRLQVLRLDFERFVSALVSADADRRELGSAPFAMAAFHPDADADLGDAERLIPFLRRTPDPTIQLVRSEALNRVREGFHEGTEFIDMETIATLDLSPRETLPLRERIARANLRTVERLGTDEMERRLLAIFADRDATYPRALGPES